MKRNSAIVVVLAIAASVVFPVAAHADDVEVPVGGSPCPAGLVGTMSLLPDEQTYVRCQQSFGLSYTWVPVQTPFDPNGSWLSYGPAITLHGQGKRNPNLTSGSWTATPQDPETICRAAQTTVVEAGVLAEPMVVESEQGRSLALEILPRLFYIELAGNCVWAEK